MVFTAKSRTGFKKKWRDCVCCVCGLCAFFAGGEPQEGEQQGCGACPLQGALVPPQGRAYLYAFLYFDDLGLADGVSVCFGEGEAAAYAQGVSHDAYAVADAPGFFVDGVAAYRCRYGVADDEGVAGVEQACQRIGAADGHGVGYGACALHRDVDLFGA